MPDYSDFQQQKSTSAFEKIIIKAFNRIFTSHALKETNTSPLNLFSLVRISNYG